MGGGMAYDDFTLETLKEQFDLDTDERSDYFVRATPATISPKLRDHLDKYVPLALAIGTEKARSEFIIAPVLLELLDQYERDLSLFSGVEFNADPERGLCGVCDYILSLAPEQLTIEAPVVTVVEAKNENIRQGINQCIAEMVAAQVFNRSKGHSMETLYGVVTTGSNWRFLRLKGSLVYVDRSEYHISHAEKIVGILLTMLREAAGQTA